MHEVLDGLIVADLIDHEPVPGQPPGPEGFTFWVDGMHAAFPDMTGVIEDTVVEGDRIAAPVVWIGTLEGEFLDLLGAGRPVSIAMHLVRFEGRGGRGTVEDRRSARHHDWFGCPPTASRVGQLSGVVRHRLSSRRPARPVRRWAWSGHGDGGGYDEEFA